MPARFLVIEDLPANLELLRVLLEAFGHKVEAALDGCAGVKAATAMLPDIVLCDLQMDGLNGFEVAEELRKNPEMKDIPLIAVTALVTDGVEERARASGFNGYISKPIQARQFVPQVEQYLSEDLRGAAPS